MGKVRWGKAILNGFIAWLIGFVINMAVAIGYSFIVWGRLMPSATDYTAMGEQIGREVAALYAGNWLLIGALMLITALLILWRARAVAMRTGQSRWLNGLVVGATAAVLSLVLVLCGEFGLDTVVTIVVYLGAGVVGGLLARA